MIELLLLLTLKHFIVDALLQTPYQYLNKDKFLHPGGLLHAALHGIGTIICFSSLSIQYMIFLGLIDTIIHYFIDYFKMNIQNRYNWSEYINNKEHKYLKVNSDNFFIILIFDQCLHFSTYILLISLITTTK